MKDTTKRLLHKTFQYGLCMAMLSSVGVLPAMAQDDNTENSGVAYDKRKAQKAKEEKKYEMMEVSGRITDNATGDPMGGVRVQALGGERWSCLTEEDGSYKLSVPTFTTSLYVYALSLIHI